MNFHSIKIQGSIISADFEIFPTLLGLLQYSGYQFDEIFITQKSEKLGYICITQTKKVKNWVTLTQHNPK
jgi:hypothetical protein